MISMKEVGKLHREIIMKQFITLICLVAVLGCGGINKPCPQTLVFESKRLIDDEWVVVGEFDTDDECRDAGNRCVPKLKEVCE